MSCYPAYIFCDGHPVVIENDHHCLSALPCVGQSFVCQTACHGAVPQQGQHAVVLVIDRSGPGHTQSHGHAVGGMSCNKRIRSVLGRLRKTGQAAQLAQRMHQGTAAGEVLMRITLVSYIKYQAVHIEIIDAVDGDGEFHNAKAGRQMSSGA